MHGARPGPTMRVAHIWRPTRFLLPRRMPSHADNCTFALTLGTELPLPPPCMPTCRYMVVLDKPLGLTLAPDPVSGQVSGRAG